MWGKLTLYKYVACWLIAVRSLLIYLRHVQKKSEYTTELSLITSVNYWMHWCSAKIYSAVLR